MLDQIGRILATVGQPDSPLKPTELFNEGWMLRLVLDYLNNTANRQHPFSFSPRARWFSEGLLPSPFLTEYRGDPRAEGWTNADGVVGHLAVGRAAKGDLSLLPSANQFVVIEAKMFSGLSTGVRRCAGYDQASRYLACIAEAVRRSTVRPEQIDRLAFYVVAPRCQIHSGVFGHRLTKESVQRSVRSRVDMYGGARDDWFASIFQPTLSVIQLELISWEDVLEGLPSYLHTFYERCVEFNR